MNNNAFHVKLDFYLIYQKVALILANSQLQQLMVYMPVYQLFIVNIVIQVVLTVYIQVRIAHNVQFPNFYIISNA